MDSGCQNGSALGLGNKDLTEAEDYTTRRGRRGEPGRYKPALRIGNARSMDPVWSIYDDRQDDLSP
jgi:hypothetical protein